MPVGGAQAGAMVAQTGEQTKKGQQQQQQLQKKKKKRKHSFDSIFSNGKFVGNNANPSTQASVGVGRRTRRARERKEERTRLSGPMARPLREVG